MTNDKKGQIIVIDFAKASVVKSCDVPPGGVSLYAWLADSPAPGPSIQWLSYDLKGPVAIGNLLRGMILDPSVECGKSFSTLQMEDARFAVAQGSAGIADVAPFDMQTYIGLSHSPSDEPGRVYSVTGTDLPLKKVPFEYVVPAEFLRDMSFSSASVTINDSKSLVLPLISDVSYRILVLRKRDKTWHVIPETSELAPHLRGFGRYIVSTEIQKPGPSRRTPGRERWRAEPGKMGPNVAGRIAREVYPGRLHIYDIETEQMHPLSTNQGDSEVLLIEGNTIYYRAADQLYSAAITPRGIGAPHLLATDDAIRDAHWAFLKN